MIKAQSLIWDCTFTREHVLEILNVTPKALEHTLDPKRQLLRLDATRINPGTGRKRMFSGGDIIQLKALYALARVGFPMPDAAYICEGIASRAAILAPLGRGALPHQYLAIAWTDEGICWPIIFYQGGEEPDLPLTCQFMDVDRLISETMRQLLAVKADEPIPDFSWKPKEKPE